VSESSELNKVHDECNPFFIAPVKGGGRLLYFLLFLLVSLSANAASDAQSIPPVQQTIKSSKNNHETSTFLPSDRALTLKRKTKMDYTGVNASSWMMAVLGLGVVIAFIFALAWFLKRFTGLTGTDKSPIKVLSILNVGTRERVALIQVAGEQLLIGITPQSIRLLKSFEGVVVRVPEPESDFASRLQTLLKKNTTTMKRDQEPKRDE